MTTYTYNTDGTVATSTDPLQRVTKFAAYDPSGQPTEIVDAKNRTTRDTLRDPQTPCSAGQNERLGHAEALTLMKDPG